MEMGHTGGMEPGRVILAVNDMSMVDFFRMQVCVGGSPGGDAAPHTSSPQSECCRMRLQIPYKCLTVYRRPHICPISPSSVSANLPPPPPSPQFSQLPAPIELVPTLGDDNTLKLVQQAATLGGCDCVLLHPELLRDRSPAGLVARLRMMGQRVVAFGWAPSGPVCELIEGSGLDGWIEGPSFGSGINPQQLAQVVVRMQNMRKQAAMMMMGSPGMGGEGGEEVVQAHGARGRREDRRGSDAWEGEEG